jgi:hypothetical protein
MSAGTSGASEDARRAFQIALEMARQEAPPSEFAEQLANSLEYRVELARELAPRNRWRGTRGIASGALFLAAAALAVWMRSRPALPAITAEASATGVPGLAAPPPARDPCRARRIASGAAPLIDDFEDGDDSLTPLEDRSGLWRWVRETDARGTAPALLPIPRVGGTRKNQLALHVKGALLVDWGATVEFTFAPGCYDASRYRGLAFDARGPGRIYVAPREVHTIPVDEGGTCEEECHNPHVAKVHLSETWQSHTVLWEDVRQRGAGRPGLDPTRLHSLAFLIRPEDTPYDVWIDDVRFVP